MRKKVESDISLGQLLITLFIIYLLVAGLIQTVKWLI